MGMRLSISPFRQWYKHELPKRLEIEDWENNDDIWIKKNGEYYNVSEFCTIGCSRIPLPRGGAQIATNGYFMIAGYEGEIWGVVEYQDKKSTQVFIL